MKNSINSFPNIFSANEPVSPKPQGSKLVRNKKRKPFHWSLVLFLVGFLSFGLACKHDDYIFAVNQIPFDQPAPVQVNSVASLATRSADNYDDNNYGLITGKTLQRWLQNWRSERPAGIGGNLILIHTSLSTAQGPFIDASEQDGIFSYAFSDALGTLGESRSNGVITTIDMVLTGKKFEEVLGRFGINPSQDLIVFIPDGVGTQREFWAAGRSWYSFRYWGVDAKNLAILNGGSGLDSSEGQGGIPGFWKNNRLSIEGRGSDYKVASRRVDNTILQATLGDMMDYVRGELSFNPGISIVDARSEREYNANRDIGGAEWKFTPSSNSTSSSPQAVAFEGHIKGAKNLPFGDLLESIPGADASSRRYKTLAEVESRFNQLEGYSRGNLVLTYCRTNVRAMITGFASAAIIGNPTRFYDGSWIEWGSLSSETNVNGSVIRPNHSESGHRNLPVVSPWRTDRSEFTQNFTPANNYNTSANLGTVQSESVIISTANAYNENTNRAVQEDKDYIRGVGGSSGGGDGSSTPVRPGNPCGG